MNKRQLYMIGISLFIYLVFITPLFFAWSDQVRACAVLIIMQILWIGRVFPLAYTSLILMLILAFHFMSYGKVLGYVGSPIVWLLFATYLLSGAFIRSGLANRLSLRILSWSKGSGGKMVGASFFLMGILALLIPSNIGRASLVSSVLNKMTESIRQVEKVDRLPKALFIGICYVTALTGGILATGASSTIYAFGLINEVSTTHFTFITWLLYMAPPVIVFLILLWVILKWRFPFENIPIEPVASFLEKELKMAGKLKKGEKAMIFIIAGTVILWVAQPLHHYSIPLIGLLGGVATVLPGLGIWTWEEARKRVNWDMILFFASTLMLSNLLITSGFLKSVSGYLVSLVNTNALFWLMLVFLVLVFVLRILFVNVLGIMTFIIPLSFSIGEQLHGVSPTLFALTFFLAGVPGFFLITQSPVHMISFAYGYFNEKELAMTGIFSSIIWLGILLVTAIFYWNGLLF